MKIAETLLQQQSQIVEENMPPVRGSNCSVPLSQVKWLLLMYIPVHLYKNKKKVQAIHYFMTESSSKEKEEFYKTSSAT